MFVSILTRIIQMLTIGNIYRLFSRSTKNGKAAISVPVVLGYGQLGRHGTPASQAGCTDIFRTYAPTEINSKIWNFSVLFLEFQCQNTSYEFKIPKIEFFFGILISNKIPFDAFRKMDRDFSFLFNLFYIMFVTGFELGNSWT